MPPFQDLALLLIVMQGRRGLKYFINLNLDLVHGKQDLHPRKDLDSW